MLRLASLFIAIFCLSSCATFSHHPNLQLTSELLQGKRDFDTGYYTEAMHRLLPLACDGDAQAQYAVGYMFYYGYGVAQDTIIGCFWIKRAAASGFPPAIAALKTAAINAETAPKLRSVTLSPQLQARALDQQ